FPLLRAHHDLRHLIGSQLDRQHPILKTVIREDVRKRRRKDCPKTKLTERPRRMLARRATAEVLICNQYRRTFIARLVQHKLRIRFSVGQVTPVVKKKLSKPCALDAFEKLLRNNLVRIDIRTIQRRYQTRMFVKWLHPRFSAFIRGLFKFPVADIREVPRDRSRGRHHRTDEMRAAATSLAPFEVSITRRRTTLARLKYVGVHTQTHRASRFAPLETRLVENAIEPFAFRGLLHVLRTRHNHRTHRRIDPVTL